MENNTMQEIDYKGYKGCLYISSETWSDFVYGWTTYYRVRFVSPLLQCSSNTLEFRDLPVVSGMYVKWFQEKVDGRL